MRHLTGLIAIIVAAFTVSDANAIIIDGSSFTHEIRLNGVSIEGPSAITFDRTGTLFPFNGVGITDFRIVEQPNAQFGKEWIMFLDYSLGGTLPNAQQGDVYEIILSDIDFEDPGDFTPIGFSSLATASVFFPFNGPDPHDPNNDILRFHDIFDFDARTMTIRQEIGAIGPDPAGGITGLFITTSSAHAIVPAPAQLTTAPEQASIAIWSLLGMGLAGIGGYRTVCSGACRFRRRVVSQDLLAQKAQRTS